MQEKSTDYVKENQQLRLMHEERMKRSQLTASSSCDISVDQSSVFSVIEDKKNYRRIDNRTPNSQVSGHKIWLNNVVYDKRLPEFKINYFSLPSLFQTDPSVFAMKAIQEQVQAVMITTFGFQTQVFLPIIKSGVPFFLFNRKEQLIEGKIQRGYSGFGNFTVVSPPKKMKGYGVFHPKLWIIKFKSFLRVVIATANNHIQDWSMWQNAFWFQDFRPKPKESKQQSTQLIFDYAKDFQQTLNQVLNQIQPLDFNLQTQMKFKLSDYDFRDVKAVLIPSIPGSFKGEQKHKYGYQKIKKVLSAVGPKYKKAILTCNSTSLGSLDQRFLGEIYKSFCSSPLEADCFKLVYPTFQYVRGQTCGEVGVLFFSEKNYKGCALREQLFHRYEPSPCNGVKGGIPHLKTVIIEEQESYHHLNKQYHIDQQKQSSEVQQLKASSKGEQFCTLYIGSHNMTKAAWGSSERNGNIKCSNFQLGILFPQYPKDYLLNWLPYEYPPQRYGAEDKPFLRNI